MEPVACSVELTPEDGDLQYTHMACMCWSVCVGLFAWKSLFVWSTWRVVYLGLAFLPAFCTLRLLFFLQTQWFRDSLCVCRTTINY
jgi:hypothetical protein